MQIESVDDFLEQWRHGRAILQLDDRTSRQDFDPSSMPERYRIGARDTYAAINGEAYRNARGFAHPRGPAIGKLADRTKFSMLQTPGKPAACPVFCAVLKS